MSAVWVVMVITNQLGPSVRLEIALELGPSLLHWSLSVTGVPGLGANGQVRSGHTGKYSWCTNYQDIGRHHAGRSWPW